MHTLGAFEIPNEEISFSYSRSSGSGGQNVNKVSSKAVLQWNIGANTSIPRGVLLRFRSAFGNRINSEDVLVLQSDIYRDQPKNKEDCLEKLKEMLKSVAMAPRKRIRTKPTRSSVERRVQAKKRVGTIKKQRKVRDSDLF